MRNHHHIQRQCYDELARFTLTASFMDELNDYWYNELNQNAAVIPQPRTWLEGYLNGLIESGQIVALQSNSREIAYSGPSVPFYEHRGISF